MQKSPDQILMNKDSRHFESNSQETEAELCIFYESVLKSLYKCPAVEFDEIRKSLQNMRSYKNFDVIIHKVAPFDKKSYRCAYVYAYCILHSIVMYDRFSDMLKKNPSMPKKITSVKKLRLCLLGGGPAFEAVALSKLLRNILISLGPAECPPFHVYVTVIDIYADWETEAGYVIKSLQNEFSAKNNMEIDFKFIKADLTEVLSPDVKEEIKKAHFVTMFKFLSEIDIKYRNFRISALIHWIIDSMSFKACLFFLDNSGGGVFNRLDREIEKLPCTSRIYGPYLHNCHFLSLDTVEKFSSALRSIFRSLKCTDQTTVSCSAWMKIRNGVGVKKLSSNVPASILKDVEMAKSKEKPRKVKVKKVLQSPQN